MDPETQKRLTASPDFRAFLEFLLAEVNKLDTLGTLPGLDFRTQADANAVAIEVKARLIAIDRAVTIISPFMDTRPTPIPKVDASEYAVP